MAFSVLRLYDQVVSGSDHDDRRTHRRVPVQLVVEYADAGELVADTTVNFSIGGTFIITDRAVDVGTHVSLRLSFPGLNTPVAAAASYAVHNPVSISQVLSTHCARLPVAWRRRGR